MENKGLLGTTATLIFAQQGLGAGPEFERGQFCGGIDFHGGVQE